MQLPEGGEHRVLVQGQTRGEGRREQTEVSPSETQTWENFSLYGSVCCLQPRQELLLWWTGDDGKGTYCPFCAVVCV